MPPHVMNPKGVNEINCPECGKVFKIDETGYAKILKQVRDDAFDQELEKRLELAEKDKNQSIELAKRNIKIQMQETVTTKETKIQGLKKYYGVSSKEGLEFFEAHKSADVIHRAECEKLLDGLSKEEQVKAEQASILTARYLWNFLSGMTSKHKLQSVAA